MQILETFFTRRPREAEVAQQEVDALSDAVTSKQQQRDEAYRRFQETRSNADLTRWQALQRECDSLAPLLQTAVDNFEQVKRETADPQRKADLKRRQKLIASLASEQLERDQAKLVSEEVEAATKLIEIRARRRALHAEHRAKRSELVQIEQRWFGEARSKVHWSLDGAEPPRTPVVDALDEVAAKFEHGDPRRQYIRDLGLAKLPNNHFEREG